MRSTCLWEDFHNYLKLFILPTYQGRKKGLRATGHLSYTRMRELLIDRLESLGYPAYQFGIHSLRSGGASAAAQAGVSDRLFKKHGRWRSETAKDGYIT